MNKKVIRHFVFWLLYLAFEIYTEVLWMMSQDQKLNLRDGLKTVVLAESAIALLVKVPVVYISFYLIGIYTRRKIDVLFIAKILLVFSAFILLYRLLATYLLLPYVYKMTGHVFWQAQGFINASMDTIFILVVAISLKQYSVSQKLLKRERALIKEKLETELNFLKAQINPHFLFNTLNNIYSLARKKSDETPGVVLKLSELLRFVLYEAKNKTITITKEIQFLNDYIELEKIRYTDRLDVEFDYKVDNPDSLIVPLILVPFVENAFKHGASEATQKSTIKIRLVLQNGILNFKVGNSFEYTEGRKNEEGIGLKNLQRQLELLYEDFALKTHKDDQFYDASLLLNLNKKL